MSYHLHTTDGIIIARRPTGESNVWCWILTRELGLVGVHAQGVRALSSKLRPHVQVLTRGSFSMIRGKHSWRLVGAEKYSNLYNENPHITPLFSRVLSLIKILVAGEEQHTELYDVVEKAFLYGQENTLSDQHSGSLERLMVLRVLYYLGYVGETALLDSYGTEPDVTVHHLENALHDKSEFIKLINTSLRETQF